MQQLCHYFLDVFLSSSFATCVDERDGAGSANLRLHGGGGIRGGGIGGRGGTLVGVHLRVELLRGQRGLLLGAGLGLGLGLTLRTRTLGRTRLGLGAALLGAGPGDHLGHHLASAAAAAVEGDGAPPPRGGDGDAGGEGHAARCSADEFNLERAPVELDAVVRLDGLDGVAFVGEDNLRGALGPAVLVEVEAGLLHLADLREQLLRVANSEWRLGEGIRCQGPFVESIRVGEAA
mmetsp:Transcript_11605/g.54004  ORF Transcript_11605/g.54004 Transcript_11605/m.54004 type:complete len:234 (-) Transcript_11605:710-1411(-)